MKDNQEVNESPEVHIAKPTEKQIETYDDLKDTDKSEQINTYDDISKQDKSGSIKTYDDLRGTEQVGDKTKSTDATDKAVKDTSELTEQKKIDQAAEDIKKNGWTKPDKWKTLSVDEKRIALDHSGKALRDAYNTPDPPLITKRMDDPSLLGEYGDGYKYDSQRDKYNGRVDINPSDFGGHGIVGSDYGIRMNEVGFNSEKNKKLFGDDPREALETYAHEFRHSYQSEQAHAYDKGFKVDDPEKAREWSENLKNYKQPPDAELAKTEPERFYKEYEAYINQPVERDAREFGVKLTARVYGPEKEMDLTRK